MTYLSLIGGIKGCGRVEDSFLGKVEEFRDIMQFFGRTLKMGATILNNAPHVFLRVPKYLNACLNFHVYIENILQGLESTREGVGASRNRLGRNRQWCVDITSKQRVGWGDIPRSVGRGLKFLHQRCSEPPFPPPPPPLSPPPPSSPGE